MSKASRREVEQLFIHNAQIIRSEWGKLRVSGIGYVVALTSTRETKNSNARSTEQTDMYCAVN